MIKNSKIQKIKIALFYDWLNQWGGAEKVLLNLIKLYPDAPIYTLIHDQKKTKWLPKNTKIVTSFIDKLPFSKKIFPLYSPLFPLAVEQFNFSKFDLVISTSSAVGHCLLTQPKTKFICYLHNINRHIYQKKYIWPISLLISIFKKIDKIYCQRPDFLFCNSQTVQNRIKKNYHRSSQIVYPGVDTSFFIPTTINTNEKYFLTVSRLVPYKKIDLAIYACHKLNKKLLIVGTGRDQKRLNKIIKSLKNPNIKLLGQVNNQQLLKLYQNCQALICPQIEDFGLTPIEVQACGKPVIAYQKGGLTETVTSKTGIFFKFQTVQSLTKAIQKLNSKKISSSDCRLNSLRFSNKNFMLDFKKKVDLLL